MSHQTARVRLAVVLSSLGFGLNALAANLPTTYVPYAWTGAAGDHMVKTAGNWEGNVVPKVINASETVYGVCPCWIFPEGAGIVSNNGCSAKSGTGIAGIRTFLHPDAA